jgi:hypothetical protein
MEVDGVDIVRMVFVKAGKTGKLDSHRLDSGAMVAGLARFNFN